MTDAAGFFDTAKPPLDDPQPLAPAPVGISGLSSADRRVTLDLPIVRLAPILAGTMVVLLIVWLLVNLF